MLALIYYVKMDITKEDSFYSWRQLENNNLFYNEESGLDIVKKIIAIQDRMIQ